jgi:4-aminobutyrate aminotransferase-like enzyme
VLQASKERGSRRVSATCACCKQGILIGLGGQDGNVIRIQSLLVISREQR